MSASPPKRHQTLKVILDSNAFFTSLEFKIDIFEETRRLLKRNVDFVLLSQVKRELEFLASGDEPKTRRQANFALQLAEKCIFVSVEDMDEVTDDVIVRVAKSWNVPVFTNDRALKVRLRDISVPVIYLRQKSRLVIDGLIS
jgi:rRNA-processing protein FCF1